MKRFLLIAVFLGLVAHVQAQVTSTNARRIPGTTGAPTGSCISGPPWTSVDIRLNTGHLYACLLGVWTDITASGSGTVTVVGAGSLTSTAFVTGGGSQALQTPSATSTLDSSGNAKFGSVSTGSSPPSLTVGTGGAFGLGEGTAATAAASVAVCYADSTSHTIKCAWNNGTFYSIPLVIASGTASMGTTTINSGTCGSAIDGGTATGVLTTDRITATVNADPVGTTGYTPSTSGSLYIWAYPTADHVNFKLCNQTSSNITPTAITLNWAVIR